MKRVEVAADGKSVSASSCVVLSWEFLNSCTPLVFSILTRKRPNGQSGSFNSPERSPRSGTPKRWKKPPARTGPSHPSTSTSPTPSSTPSPLAPGMVLLPPPFNLLSIARGSTASSSAPLPNSLSTCGSTRFGSQDGNDLDATKSTPARYWD